MSSRNFIWLGYLVTFKMIRSCAFPSTFLTQPIKQSPRIYFRLSGSEANFVFFLTFQKKNKKYFYTKIIIIIKCCDIH